MENQRTGAGGDRKVVLFYRDFRRFSGGNLKIWDYFNHVAHSPQHVPRIWFSKETVWDESNPWLRERSFVVESDTQPSADILFLGGNRRPLLISYPARRSG